LKDWLLSTGVSVLAEIAIEDGKGRIRYKDLIWGIGIGPNNKDIDQPDQWHNYGEKLLGNDIRNSSNFKNCDDRK